MAVRSLHNNQKEIVGRSALQFWFLLSRVEISSSLHSQAFMGNFNIPAAPFMKVQRHGWSVQRVERAGVRQSNSISQEQTQCVLKKNAGISRRS